VEDPPDHRVGRLESLVVVVVLGYAEAGAQLRTDAEVQDVRDPFQDDLAAGVLGAEVEADQEASEVQGAVSASREVDELLQQRDELAVVDFLDRCFDVGVVDESALGAHRQEALVAIAGQAA